MSTYERIALASEHIRVLEVCVGDVTDLPNITCSALSVRNGVVTEIVPGYSLIFESISTRVDTGLGGTKTLRMTFPRAGTSFYVGTHSIEAVYVGPYHDATYGTGRSTTASAHGESAGGSSKRGRNLAWTMLAGMPYWNGYIFPIAAVGGVIRLTNSLGRTQEIWILDKSVVLQTPNDVGVFRERLRLLPNDCPEPDLYPIGRIQCPWMSGRPAAATLPVISPIDGGTYHAQTAAEKQPSYAYSPDLAIVFSNDARIESVDLARSSDASARTLACGVGSVSAVSGSMSTVGGGSGSDGDANVCVGALPCFLEREDCPYAHVTLPVPQYTLVERDGVYDMWGDCGTYVPHAPPPRTLSATTVVKIFLAAKARYCTVGNLLCAVRGLDGIVRGCSTALAAYNLPGFSTWVTHESVAIELHRPEHSATAHFYFADGRVVVFEMEPQKDDENARNTAAWFREEAYADSAREELVSSPFYCISKEMTLPMNTSGVLSYCAKSDELMVVDDGCVKFLRGCSVAGQTAHSPAGPHIFSHSRLHSRPDSCSNSNSHALSHNVCYALSMDDYLSRVPTAGHGPKNATIDVPLIQSSNATLAASSNATHASYLFMDYAVYEDVVHPVLTWRQYAGMRARSELGRSGFLKVSFGNVLTDFVKGSVLSVRAFENAGKIVETVEVFLPESTRKDGALYPHVIFKRPLVVYDVRVDGSCAGTSSFVLGQRVGALVPGTVYLAVGIKNCALFKVNLHISHDLSHAIGPYGARRSENGWVVAAAREIDDEDSELGTWFGFGVSIANATVHCDTVSTSFVNDRHELFGTANASYAQNWYGPYLTYDGWFYPICGSSMTSVAITAFRGGPQVSYKRTIPACSLDEALDENCLKTFVCPYSSHLPLDMCSTTRAIYAVATKLEKTTIVHARGVVHVVTRGPGSGGDYLHDGSVVFAPSGSSMRLVIIRYEDMRILYVLVLPLQVTNAETISLD